MTQAANEKTKKIPEGVKGCENVDDQDVSDFESGFGFTQVKFGIRKGLICLVKAGRNVFKVNQTAVGILYYFAHLIEIA